MEILFIAWCTSWCLRRVLHLQQPSKFCFIVNFIITILPSVLWRCWLGGRKGIRPVKNWVVGCWCGYLSGARCRLAYGPADATATHCLLLRKIQIGITFLVLAHPGNPGKRAIRRVCVCLLLQPSRDMCIVVFIISYFDKSFIIVLLCIDFLVTVVSVTTMSIQVSGTNGNADLQQ